MPLLLKPNRSTLGSLGLINPEWDPIALDRGTRTGSLSCVSYLYRQRRIAHLRPVDLSPRM